MKRRACPAARWRRGRRGGAGFGAGAEVESFHVDANGNVRDNVYGSVVLRMMLEKHIPIR
jgi:hypothetical protein